MRFKVDGEEYEYDGKLSVADAMFIQEKTGCTVNQIWSELSKGNAAMIAAWMYLLMRRAGKAVQWKDMLTLNVWTFDAVPDEADSASEAGEEPQDPTQPTGPIPEPGTAAT